MRLCHPGPSAAQPSQLSVATGTDYHYNSASNIRWPQWGSEEMTHFGAGEAEGVTPHCWGQGMAVVEGEG